MKAAPPSLLDVLKTYGKVVRIQPWTLLWDDRAVMERALACEPEAKNVYINLVRSELDNPKPVSEI
jgi:hypothetical protein